MFIFDVKDLVKMMSGEAEGQYGYVVDVGVNENSDTVYIVEALETDLYYWLLGKDLKLIKR